MKLNVDFDRWQQVREDARKWWDGELDRPLVQIRLWEDNPALSDPGGNRSLLKDVYDLALPPEAVVDRWEYQLSCTRYLGDAFPQIFPNLGPGVLAVFLGAHPEVFTNTVWFQPPKILEPRDLHLRLDRENAWFKRLLEIKRLAAERFQGAVQIGMTDLGGAMDVVASFRPGERLLFDLYDAPEEIERLTRDVHEAWWQAFDAFNAVIQPKQQGYTCWTPIFSDQPCYMLQCDFCYMISPEMFDRFVKPELAATCRRMKHAFYHLDGPGELPHLDSLLSIPELAGVQWIAGEGQKPYTEWPEVYRKIHKAGKKIQVFGGPDLVEVIADQVGSAKNIVAIGNAPAADEPRLTAGLKRMGVID